MTFLWQVELLGDRYNGSFSPAYIDNSGGRGGSYDAANNWIEGVSFVHGTAGWPNYFYTLRLPISGFTIHGVQVTAEWDRVIPGGDADPVIVIEHSTAGLLGSYTETNQPGIFSRTIRVAPLSLNSGTLTIRGDIDDRSPSANQGNYLRCKSIRIVGSGPIPFTPVNSFWNHFLGFAECPICYVDEVFSPQPINLRTGEKAEQISDLSLKTPAGDLSLIRSYRQEMNITEPIPSNPLDGFTGLLGAGWTHNHDVRIFTHSSYPNKLLLKLPSGGIAQFSLVSGSQYKGDPGSNSSIDAGGGVNDKYTLRNSDESLWVFDDAGRIRSRSWPNSEVWTYSYYTSGFASGLLKEISDGYGRKLQFGYVDHSGFVDHRHLKYLGDQTVVDINSPTGSEVYVQYSYSENKKENSFNPGGIIPGGQALLSTVRDLRGKNWSYAYEDSQLASLNWLRCEDSPSVDINGDGTADGLITLKELNYIFDAGNIREIVQKRGKYGLNGSYLSETDYLFQPGGANLTTEETAGRLTSHYFDGDLYLGTENPAGESASQSKDASFRPELQMDANGNTTELSWSSDGKKLNAVKDALNQSTGFAYDVLDRLFSSTDAEGKLSFYSYSGSLRQPIAIRQVDGNSLLINGNMELDASWSAISGAAPTTNERHSSFYAGSYSRRIVASAANQGIESLGISLLLGKTYHVLAHVRPVSGQAKMALSSSSKLSASASNAWEVLSLSYTPAANETISLQFRAEGDAAEFYVDEVFVWAAETVLRWQEFVYDSKGRTLEDKLIEPKDGTSLLQRSLRTYGTSGNENGLLRTSVQKNVQSAGVGESTTTYDYDAQGRIIKTAQSSLMGTCQFNYTVYDAAGNVLGTACGLVNETAPSDLTGLLALYNSSHSSKKHTRITTHLYDEMGRRVQTTSNAGMSTARSTRTIYDALSRVVRTIENYKPQGSSAPGDWVWSSANQRWEYSASNTTAVSHGSKLDENIIADTGYNERGLVYFKRDVLGRVNLSGYDLADRLVKSIQNASQPSYNASYFNGDPALAKYQADATAVDKDMISEQSYDAVGNLVKTVDLRGAVHFTVYDALNRPVKTVQNAKTTATIALNPGDSGYSAANDPRSASYTISSDPDRDMIAETVYDAMGRVQSSKRLLENRGTSPVWDETYFVYDGQGRQMRQIQHYVATSPLVTPDNWVYQSGIWKTGAGGSAISHGSNEQNIITETVYYPDGKVKETLDVQRRVSRMVYDGLGRQFMTVSNFVAQPTEPENWSWSDANNRWEYSSGNAVSHGAKLDENIISFTEYDGNGRVLESRGVDGLLQRNAYDTAGRQALSIGNYVAQGASNPVNWLWDTSDGRWEDGAGTAIARGSDFDQNLISQPTYDSEGRAFQNRDARGNLSRQVYDVSGRLVLSIQNYLAQATEPEYWVFESGNWKTQAAGSVISHGSNNDQNRLQSSSYDLLGRVFSSRDSKGRETRRVYDALGRTVRTIANYVQQGSSNPTNWLWNESPLRWEDGAGNAIAHGSAFDQNLISESVYNRAGQLVSSRDARGTETSFAYDAAGRRLSMTTAAKSAQASTNYTCYDKAGRTLRSIQGYVATAISPDAWSAGTWLFVPAAHGYHADENCITSYTYDKASRRISMTNPLGHASQSAYSLDGQILSQTDPSTVVTAYRYDKRSRRVLVVQNYIANGEDPALWLWDASDGRYEQSSGTAIVHGSNKDQNIIVQLTYDIAGRLVSQREPRGNLSSYTYDKLGRRKSLTNPLSKVWGSSYSEANGASQTTLSYPNGYSLVQDFDRFGRSLQLDYALASNTPKVNFAWDISGNRLSMVENNGTSNIRQTLYSYDQANRLTSVGFDKDGGGTIDETVAYEYDTGGLRTRLTLPGNLSVVYSYDRKGQLITLTDWSNQCSEFAYDKAARHVRTRRHNGLESLYQHDAAGRLRTLHHLEGAADIQQSFIYTVDARGNRTQAKELKPRSSGATATTMDHLYPGIVYRGDWRDVGNYHEASSQDASLSLLFYGNTGIELRMGQGPDYSIYDVYIDGTLWESFDGYAASEGERIISIPLDGTGLHLLEVKNMREKRLNSSGYTLRFKSLYGQPAFDITTTAYSYDNLARILAVTQTNPDASIRGFDYAFDLAGNRLKEDRSRSTEAGFGTSVFEYSYNQANQISQRRENAGSWTALDYDDNGNLIDDGEATYAWDRANRLLELERNLGSTSTHTYSYDGLGNRVHYSNSFGTSYDYLNDLQPGLSQLLKQNNSRYVYGPRGIHSEAEGGVWKTMLQDGLGTVRTQLWSNGGITAFQYTPYGSPSGGGSQGFHAFTGEVYDPSWLIYLRARYYSPELGIFPSLDPFEGMAGRPMSLNGYSWVEGNVINEIDPSGLSIWLALALGLICVTSLTASVPPPSGSTPAPTSPILATNEAAIKSSTVTIVMPDATGPLCSRNSLTVINLGTITPRGIVTHDHYSSNPGIPLSTPRITLTEAHNPQQAATHLSSWPCVIITGVNGSVEIDPASMNYDISSSSHGSLVIQNRQTDIHGNVSYMNDLGIAVQENTSWVPNSNGTDYIRAAHINGAQNHENAYNHAIGMFTLQVNRPTLGSWGGRPAYTSHVDLWLFNWDQPQPGDSGGGVFNNTGHLVGVTLAGEGYDGPISAGFDYFFAPLR